MGGLSVSLEAASLPVAGTSGGNQAGRPAERVVAVFRAGVARSAAAREIAAGGRRIHEGATVVDGSRGCGDDLGGGDSVVLPAVRRGADRRARVLRWVEGSGDRPRLVGTKVAAESRRGGARNCAGWRNLHRGGDRRLAARSAAGLGGAYSADA